MNDQKKQAGSETGPLAILVVAEAILDQATIGTALHRQGHSIQQVSGGYDAIRATLARDFDAMVVDLDMSIMDGITTTQWIKGLSKKGDGIKIIGLTRKYTGDLEEQCRHAGLDFLVPMPASGVELEAALHYTLSRSVTLTAAGPDRPSQPAGPPHATNDNIAHASRIQENQGPD